MGLYSRSKGKRGKGTKTHGMRNTRLYHIWANMKYRCGEKDKFHREDYFARGIRICKEWRTFVPFYKWAISHGYDDSLTLDRIDLNGNYTPDNCRWADLTTQNNNTRWNKFISFDGKRMTVSQWSRELNMSRTALYKRLNAKGWSIEKALTTPIRKK